MIIKNRHKNIIEKKLDGKFKSIQIERLRKFPKSIKFHFHLTDGWIASYYSYRIIGLQTNETELEFYCRLSPMILELYFNVTFWTEGEKYMERFRFET